MRAQAQGMCHRPYQQQQAVPSCCPGTRFAGSAPHCCHVVNENLDGTRVASCTQRGSCELRHPSAVHLQGATCCCTAWQLPGPSRTTVSLQMDATDVKGQHPTGSQTAAIREPSRSARQLLHGMVAKSCCCRQHCAAVMLQSPPVHVLGHGWASTGDLPPASVHRAHTGHTQACQRHHSQGEAGRGC